jgi:CBS domain containing-hemolysin-like protein
VSLVEWMTLAGILVCAGASCFFALAESSLFALGKWQAGQLAARFPDRGALVARLLGEPSELLATLALGNTLANGMIVALGLGRALAGDWPLNPTLAGLLALVLIVCEMGPKTLAVRDPKRWALRVAAPMQFLLRLAHPLHRVVEWLNTLLLKGVFRRAVKPIDAQVDEEYRELLDLALQQGALAPGEKEIIAQIISLDQKTAGQVMLPISQVNCLSDDLSIEAMLEAARRHRHRRLPIYDGSTETIVGVLDATKLLMDPGLDLAEAMDFPAFVPESMNLLRLLKSLQRQQRGMAIVLNEYGGTAGVVTMQDILQEMIGALPGEAPSEGFIIEKQAEGRWRVNGAMLLEDFRREHPALAEAPGVATMAGLMLRQLEIVPVPGEVAFHGNLKLTALAGDGRHVREMLVEVVKRKPSP